MNKLKAYQFFVMEICLTLVLILSNRGNNHSLCESNCQL